MPTGVSQSAKEKATMGQALEAKEFSQDTWQEFEALFGKHKGVRGGCWCVFNRCPSTQFQRMRRDERKEFLRTGSAPRLPWRESVL
jgi:hypothetical protein